MKKYYHNFFSGYMVLSAAPAKYFLQSISSFYKEKMTAAAQTRAPERRDQDGGYPNVDRWFATSKSKDGKTHLKAASPLKKQACPPGQFAKPPKIITKQPSI